MLRPWELNVNIVRNSGTPIHVQIAKIIIEEIERERFKPGEALPGTRELSNKLRVNRKTVVQAYDELIAQGWLTTENKRGTFVSSRILTASHYAKPAKISAIKVSGKKHRISDKLIHPQNNRQSADCINFCEDLPDSRLVPFEVLSRAMRHALISSVRNNKLHYSDPRGVKILREAIVQMLNMERGLNTNLDNICIVRGSQMGIWLAARVLIEAGDFIVVEQLSNPAAREAFKNCAASILTVSHIESGIDLNALESLCLSYKVRAIYVTPNHQIPTGTNMSIEDRKKLLKLADCYDFVIIEDDSNYEFNHTQGITFPIASLDTSGRVIYIGSFSKVLAPGFRIGYIVAPVHVIQYFASEISIIDRQGNTIIELALAELLLTGEIKRHILRAKKIYAERRYYISNLIKLELNEFTTHTVPISGFGLWLTIAANIDIDLLLHDAEKEKVKLMSPSVFSEHQQYISGLRLGFAHLDLEEITLGIKRLRSVFLHQADQILSA